MSHTLWKTLSPFSICLAMSQVACQEHPENNGSSTQFSIFALEDSSSKAPGPFLSADDLKKPTDTSPIEAGEISEKLKNLSSEFLTNTGREEDEPEHDPSQICMDQVVNGLKTKVIGKNLYLAGDLDFSLCLPAMSTPEVAIEVFKLRFYTQISCEGKDLAPYDGLGLKDFGETKFNCEGQMLTHEQTQSVSKVRLTFDGVEKIIESKSFHSMGTAEQKACTENSINGRHNFLDGCEKINIETQIEHGIPTHSHYQKLVYHQISWTDRDSQSWYESGAMDVTLNDWTGKIEFRSAEEAPRFELKNGELLESGIVETYSRARKKLF